jgi:hypothetical protein
VDANSVSAVVGGPFVWCGNVRPLVHSAYVPEIIREHRGDTGLFLL